MRLLALYLAAACFCLVASQPELLQTGQYMPSPYDPHVLIPVQLDPSRPRIRYQKVYVEDPPSGTGLIALLYLLVALPFLFLRPGGALGFGNGFGALGGSPGIITENPCCG